MREELKELAKDYDKSENDLKALQSVGQVHECSTFNTKQSIYIVFIIACNYCQFFLYFIS